MCKQQLALQMQTMAWNQVMCFFTALAAPESLGNLWLVQTSCWSITEGRLEQWAHAILSECSPGAARAAPAATGAGTPPTLPSWHWCPRGSAGLVLVTGHSCFVGHSWDAKNLLSFSPFSHISGKRALSKCLRKYFSTQWSHRLWRAHTDTWSGYLWIYFCVFWLNNPNVMDALITKLSNLLQ